MYILKKSIRSIMLLPLYILTHHPIIMSMDINYTTSSVSTTSTPSTSITSTTKPNEDPLSCTLLPKSIINIFDIKKDLKNNSKNLEKLIASTLVINEKTKDLIIGAKGEIYQLSLMACAQKRNPLKLLFAHAHVDHSPLLAIAQPKGYSFKLASVGNFFCSDSNEWKSNLIVYSNDSLTMKYFDWPIQTIKFDKEGKYLAIGNQCSITVLNVNTDQLISTPFHQQSTQCPLLDLAINSSSNRIIACSQTGALHQMVIHDDFTLETCSTNSCNSKIKSIHYPNDHTILIDSGSSMKAINTFELLQSNPEKLTTTIAKSEIYEQVTLDTNWNIASAHWTHSNEATAEERHTIKIFRADKKDTSKTLVMTTFTLTAPSSDEQQYKIMSNKGRLEIYNEKFFAVTLNKKYIAALCSNGKIYFWKLPKRININSPLLTSLPVVDITKQPTDTVPLKKVRRSSSPLISLTSRKRNSHKSPTQSPKISPRKNSSSKDSNLVASETTLPRKESKDTKIIKSDPQ